MRHNESFSNSLYTDQVYLAEHELAAFIGSVTELFGPEQARLSAEDWLDEAEFTDGSSRSTSRDWRAITIAASVRLANRLNVARLIVDETPATASMSLQSTMTRAARRFPY